ncbi:hypothetical protein B0J14DRAFT_319373 [Halenospora varia]|nr:hypothetical protein B0J14DRAFT_319373 [Halenospora varia]
MRLSQAPPNLLSLLLVALPSIRTAHAWPVWGHLDFSFLEGRTVCASYCGADNQYCCTAGTTCTTLAAGNVATCMAGSGTVATVGSGGGYAVYTTTFTETDLILRTSTYSSYWQAPTTVQSTYVAPAVVPICTTSLGQTSCGTICCAADQQCASAASCTARTSSWTYSATSTYSAPLRPTSGGVSTATSLVSATTTQSFIPPATASGSALPIINSGSKGLSAGAIAGIVIGTIAGVLLLLLICFCCIVKAGFDGILAIFGLGKGRRRSSERVEVVEERYSRHGSGTASRRQTHTGWFGAGKPARVTESRKKKSSSGFGGLGAVGAGLLGLAVILGLKRKSDKKKPPVSDISSSYYSYTDSYTGTSPSTYPP